MAARETADRRLEPLVDGAYGRLADAVAHRDRGAVSAGLPAELGGRSARRLWVGSRRRPAAGVTTVGPHRDELLLEIGGCRPGPTPPRASSVPGPGPAPGRPPAGHRARAGAPRCCSSTMSSPSSTRPGRRRCWRACRRARPWSPPPMRAHLPAGAAIAAARPHRGREAAGVTTWRPTAGPDARQRDPRPVAASLDRVTERLGAPPARVLATAVRPLGGARRPARSPSTPSPGRLRDGVLVVLVDQPAWATQLRYLARRAAGPHPCRRAGGSAVAEIQIRVAGQAGSTGGMRSGHRRRDGASAVRTRSGRPSESPPSGRMESSRFWPLTSSFRLLGAGARVVHPPFGKVAMAMRML